MKEGQSWEKVRQVWDRCFENIVPPGSPERDLILLAILEHHQYCGKECDDLGVLLILEQGPLKGNLTRVLWGTLSQNEWGLPEGWRDDLETRVRLLQMATALDIGVLEAKNYLPKSLRDYNNMQIRWLREVQKQLEKL